MNPTPNGFFFFSSKNARCERIPTPRTANTSTAPTRRLPAKRLPTTAKPRVDEKTRERMVFVFIPDSELIQRKLSFSYERKAYFERIFEINLQMQIYFYNPCNKRQQLYLGNPLLL